MKRILLLSIAFILAGFLSAPAQTNVTIPEQLNRQNARFDYSENEKSTNTLYIVGSRNYHYDGGGNYTLLPPEELAFTGDDIQYFNLTTREIVFSDSFVFDMQAFINLILNYYVYNVYFNDKLLLENIALVLGTNSAIYNNLVFYFEPYSTNKLYLNDGYPDIWDGWSNAENLQKAREANAEKRKENWDIFIQYLSDAGKIVGYTSIAEPPTTPESNTISIYPNPTTGELKIDNGQLKIKNVELFDIYGKKILNFQFSILNSLDVSYLPAGIYFVQVTTDKGIVTKKIVKL